MQSDAAIEYMRRVRELGFKIGLHTNGFYPNLLSRASDYIDWIGLDFKATREKYPDLTGQDIAYNNMIRSLDIWLATGKDLEVRITCDPRFITNDDLNKITDILATRNVKKIAIQKYTPYFEDEHNKTDATSRNQFFEDIALRTKIDSIFESVIWRE